MKAAVCWEQGKPLTIEDLTLAPPQTGEVKVRISACAICQSDIHFLDGGWSDIVPVVYGHEAAGTVEEVGSGVLNVKPGDRVIVSLIRSCGECPSCKADAGYLCVEGHPLDDGHHMRTSKGQVVRAGLHTGAFAEEVIVDQSQVVPVLPDMPMASASLLACGVITGFGAVKHTANMRKGASAVVIGTGGVGLNCIQGAHIGEAEQLIAVDLSEEKLTAAKEFGATHSVNPLKDDAVEAVKTLTNGGADYVFVAAGAQKALEQGIEMLGRGGTVVLVGMPGEDVKLAVDPVDIAASGKRILGSKMGSTNLERDIPELLTHYQSGRLKLDELISSTLPLSQINEAINESRAGHGLRNVVMMDEPGAF